MRRVLIGAIAVLVSIAVWRSMPRDAAPSPTVAAPTTAAPTGAPVDTTIADSIIRAMEREYAVAVQAKDVGALVALDRRLRDLVRDLNQAASEDSVYAPFPVTSAVLDVQWNGFDSAHGVYSGKLLAEAHGIDPNSRWRAHTLWSQVYATEGEAGTGPPDLVQARQYLREFPDGPFAFDAAIAAGLLYHDLFMALRDSLGDGVDGLIGACVGHLVTKAPRAEQIRLARDSALAYLDLALRVRPGGGEVAYARRRVANGEEPGTWYNCPD